MITEFKMPKMGESITEGTIIAWMKNVGDYIEAEEVLVEVATDKVDNDVPSPVSGTITEIRFEKDAVVRVGEVLALIRSEKGEAAPTPDDRSESQIVASEKRSEPNADVKQMRNNSDAFLSPLIISIAKKEDLSIEEVSQIQGSGTGGRIRKTDVFNYLKNRKYPLQSRQTAAPAKSSYPAPKVSAGANDRVIEMDRMRQMIAGHMTYSKHTAPHVTSYVEADVTDLVAWRDRNKALFEQKYDCKLTFTPIFVQAAAKAIADFPNINASVDGDKIIVRGNINIGMATALPTGNLIVPVVRNADKMDLILLAREVNRLAERARTATLAPDEIQGSTFTISNVGIFGSLMGTPIINQPEAAILALGIIKKRPEVISTSAGDEIAIRSMMFLSLSFDHRIVDGFLGGSFLRRVADYLEKFDINTTV